MQDDEPDGHLVYKDAVFISPHKFIGGPGTPGVLIAKRKLFRNSVPAVVGGGTVAYVNSQEHRYVEDAETREEGGTPAILESIRAGLVFQLKDDVGHEVIASHEQKFIRSAIERWSSHDKIRVLGNLSGWRLSIVSFVVRDNDRFLHHNFVASLLNDLFGIQARAGCSCAGPYGHRLLGIDLPKSRAFEQEILRGCEGVKPGWVRVNFNYFLSEPVFEFILAAVEFVASHGWEFLPDYSFCPKTGMWRNREARSPAATRLRDIRYPGAEGAALPPRATAGEEALATYLVDAERLLEERRARGRTGVSDDALPAGFEAMRWFPVAEDTIGR